MKPTRTLKAGLDRIYRKYNQRKYVHPDPLEFLYKFETQEAVEVAGLVASSLAYGHVKQILKSIGGVLDTMGKDPAAFLEKATRKNLDSKFSGFKHRFAKEIHMTSLLWNIKLLLEHYKTVENCCRQGMYKKERAMNGMIQLAKQLSTPQNDPGHLVALPGKGSACKRMHLFLRWMVRKYAVDLGIWKTMLPKHLIIPLDTHIHCIGVALGFTHRKSADLKTALEITDGFREVNKDDPVKYDFCLTRFGIRDELDLNAMISKICVNNFRHRF